MTEIDLDRLGDVWRQQPDPAEMERLQRTAGVVRRRARVSRILDTAGAIAAIGLVLLLVLLNPEIRTIILGSGAIVLLLVSNVRLQRLRQLELRSLTGSVEDMLNQSIERVENKLKYQRFCLFAVVPGLVVGYLAASVLRPESGVLMDLLGVTRGSRIMWTGALLAGIVGTILYLIGSIKRGHQELERLRAFGEACREERDSTGS